MQCHLVGILFYDSLTSVSLIFGGKAIHQKNPHQKSLILYIYTFQKLNPKYCLFAFEIGYFGHHASKNKILFFKFLSERGRLADFDTTTKCSIIMFIKCPLPIFDISIRNFALLCPQFAYCTLLCIMITPARIGQAKEQ